MSQWHESDCQQFINNHGIEGLRTFGVPSDYTGFRQLRDLVPYSDKKLASMTEKFLSRSAEYRGPRLKSDANYAHQDLRQKLPNPVTRKMPTLPFESGPGVLPGMEEFMSLADQKQMATKAGVPVYDWSWGGE
jgi:hypothetical protein